MACLERENGALDGKIRQLEVIEICGLFSLIEFICNIFYVANLVICKHSVLKNLLMAIFMQSMVVNLSESKVIFVVKIKKVFLVSSGIAL